MCKCNLKRLLVTLVYLQMSGQDEYDNDILVLNEEVNLDTPPSSGSTTANESPAKNWKIVAQPPRAPPPDVVLPVLRLTPHTAPTLGQPAIINGRAVTDLKIIKPSTTIQEVREREENTYQKFVTREGAVLYLERHTISKIDFEACKNKRWDKTINLGQFQVRLRVMKNGSIMFRNYHRRGQSKYNSNYPY